MPKERTRAWRRANHVRHARRRTSPRLQWKPEKNWKLMYLRSEKLGRARQLGRVWPRQEWLKLMAELEPVRVLFICSQNQWRSPTAEKVWAKVQGVTTRSAGTSRNARRHLTINDIRWADLILVMEPKHRSRIEALFREEVRFKPLYVLDVPDHYKFMDPDLIDILTDKAEPLIRARLDGA